MPSFIQPSYQKRAETKYIVFHLTETFRSKSSYAPKHSISNSIQLEGITFSTNQARLRTKLKKERNKRGKIPILLHINLISA